MIQRVFSILLDHPVWFSNDVKASLTEARSAPRAVTRRAIAVDTVVPTEQPVNKGLMNLMTNQELEIGPTVNNTSYERKPCEYFGV